MLLLENGEFFRTQLTEGILFHFAGGKSTWKADYSAARLSSHDVFQV